ncbi:MAG: hypothetical protein H6Q72_3687 [Firmicutes bacterium]|nr:hypothetical protein [Bacillota bacterium]
MGKDCEPLDWCVKKYISKYKCAYPSEPTPTITEVEEYIQSRWDKNKHIVYPLAGQDWSQAEFEEAYRRNEEYNR